MLCSGRSCVGRRTVQKEDKAGRPPSIAVLFELVGREQKAVARRVLNIS